VNTFWELIGRNLKLLIIAGFIGVLLATGVYNIDRFINIVEQVALNLSYCGG